MKSKNLDKTRERKKPMKVGLLYVPLKDQGDEVERLAGLGFTQEEIALITGMAECTLKEKYSHQLRVGTLKADAAVLANLVRMAAGDGPQAASCAIFFAKVRRNWHEVQRVIHGFDPAALVTFVRETVRMLKRELPQRCPHCKTDLNLTPKIAEQMVALSQRMAAALPESSVQAMPRPTLAQDGLDAAPPPEHARPADQ